MKPKLSCFCLEILGPGREGVSAVNSRLSGSWNVFIHSAKYRLGASVGVTTKEIVYLLKK